jgi:hypothetical protein
VNTITLEALRGMAAARQKELDLDIVRYGDFWAVRALGRLLLDARDDVRTFRTLDTVHAFCKRHLSGCGANVRLSFMIHVGLDL